MFRFRFAFTVAAVLAGSVAVVSAQRPAVAASQPHESVAIDANAAGSPFPHYWEQMAGSGRAHLVMRAQYQSDLRLAEQVMDLRYVRFHAILDDENGVYSEDAQGRPVYNWSYVDHIYDALLANKVRPYVEISFMPSKLAARPDYQGFWYHPIVSPPADYAKWDALITAFARHLVDRYGINEVAQWYFEVWNEPNIGFWSGKPAETSYFQLYDHTARALKAVNPRLRVGGPATAQAAWVDDMITHAVHDHVPLDFVSTHVYGDDSAADVFHDHRNIAPHQMVCAAVDKVHQEILHSARPAMPLIWSEFNASYANHQEITDSIYMGPWLAGTIRQCDGMTQMMSYWTFSDVFEEQGVKQSPFYGGFGIVAEDGIPKPAYNAFKLLHMLGEERLPAAANDVLATRRKDGTVVIAAWNLVEPGAEGTEKAIDFHVSGAAANARVTISRVDSAHGDTLDAWKRMGSPQYPTQQQVVALRKAAEIGPPQVDHLHGNRITITVPPMGLTVIQIR